MEFIIPNETARALREAVLEGCARDMARRLAQVVVRVYVNGAPRICISCGAKTDDHGSLPCGH